MICKREKPTSDKSQISTRFHMLLPQTCSQTNPFKKKLDQSRRHIKSRGEHNMEKKVNMNRSYTYPKIPQKYIRVNLIALENFRKNFPPGFHHLYTCDCCKIGEMRGAEKPINCLGKGDHIINKRKINQKDHHHLTSQAMENLQKPDPNSTIKNCSTIVH